MIATAKANSLPEDLRTHWEDAMAEKFPMSMDDAMGYIKNRYGDEIQSYPSGRGIQVSYVTYVKESRPVFSLYSERTVLSSPEYQEMRRPVFHEAVITEYKKPTIDSTIKRLIEEGNENNKRSSKSYTSNV